MAYPQKVMIGSQVSGSSSQNLLDCSGSNTVEFILPSTVNLQYISAQIQTTFNSSGNSVVTAYYRPQPGSATNQVSLGTLSIPTAAADPAFYYKAVGDNVCYAGGSLAFVVTTAATSAGKIFPMAEGSFSPEIPANVPNAVASA